MFTINEANNLFKNNIKDILFDVKNLLDDVFVVSYIDKDIHNNYLDIFSKSGYGNIIIRFEYKGGCQLHFSACYTHQIVDLKDYYESDETYKNRLIDIIYNIMFGKLYYDLEDGKRSKEDTLKVYDVLYEEASKFSKTFDTIVDFKSRKDFENFDKNKRTLPVPLQNIPHGGYAGVVLSKKELKNMGFIPKDN